MAAIACAIALPSFSQNTKGDKPSNNQRGALRIPHLKSKKKGGDRANTKDVAGRRLRTKNKSSAGRAVQTKSLPFARKRPSEVSRVGKPLLHIPKNLRSGTAKAARNNIYPSNGPYVNNPSPKPHDNQRAVSNKRERAIIASEGTRHEPPGRKKRITPRSASSSWVTRGRKNVYWGKFRKGERPITTDLTGRSLRAKNFHSPGLGVVPAHDVYRKRKKTGEVPYRGSFKSGYVTSGKRNERAWRGDVSGHAIRSRAPRVSQTPGQTNYSLYESNSFRRGKTSRPIPTRYHGKGIGIFGKFLNRVNGVRRPKGGGSVSRGFNNKGEPVMGKAPGIGAKHVGVFQGFGRGRRNALAKGGLGFPGSIKARRAPKGGGSISGKGLSNKGQPIQVRAPGIGANMGNFRGNIRGKGKAFSQDGLSYSGSIKSGRQQKGGGSNSGRGFNNGGRPINVKAPGIGANMGNFKGNLKSSRAAKGGGSISGSWNNANRPINVKAPGFGAKFVDQYQGFIRRRGPKAFSQDGLSYAGDVRASRAPKGGGSISGKLWNNKEKPILVKAPGAVTAKEVGYSGHIRLPFFQRKFVRNPNQDKAALKKVKPNKGIYDVAGLQIKVKQADYERNKVSAKGSLKGIAPGKNSAKAAEYDGRMKMLWAFKHNPSSHRDAQKAIKPTKAFTSGNTFAGGLRMKKYVHNPNSNKNALDVVSPGRAMARIKDYQGNLKMSKPHGKNLHPDSQFAHGSRDNVKQERTFLMNIKLKWAKLFRKNATQPDVVKEKVRRPRYDKKERELWKDLYD